MVRLVGCNLRCSWCDTSYSFHGGSSRSLDAVMQEVGSFSQKRVTITGGEPLLHGDVPELAERMVRVGYAVSCETSGERDISVLPDQVKVIMDLKAPGSGEHSRNRWSNIQQLSPSDEVKIVIKDRADFDWAMQELTRHRVFSVCDVLLSPVHGELAPDQLSRWVLEAKIDARINLQAHKYIFGDVPGV